MTLRKKFALGGLIIVMGSLACIAWLLGTESGTRFLIARAQPFFPAELALGETRGSLISGIRVASVDWNGDTLDVAISDAYIEIQLAELLSKHLDVRSLDVSAISITSRSGAESEEAKTLSSFESPLDISVDTSSIRNLSIAYEGQEHRIDGIQFKGTLDGAQLKVARFALRSSWLNAELEGIATLANSYPGKLDLRWRWTASPSLQLGGDLQLRGDMRRYEIEHLLSAPQNLTTTGHVSYVANEVRFDLSNDWKALEWPLGESLLESPSGTLRLKGSPKSIEVSLAALATVDDFPETRIDLEGDLDPDSMRFSRFAAVSNLGRLESSGTVGWSRTPEFDLEYAISGLDPSSVSALFEGQIDARGSARGTLADGAPDVTVLVSELSGAVNSQPLDGSGAVGYSTERILVTSSRIRLGGNEVRVNGVIADALSLDAELQFPAIQELIPSASGSLSANVVLRGSTERPELRLNAAGSALAWSGYAIEGATIDARVSAAQEITANVSVTRARLGANDIDSAEFSVAGTVDKHTLRSELVGKGGRINAEAAGGYQDSQWAGSINALSVDHDRAGRWSLQQPTDLIASLDETALSAACLVRATESGNACLQGAIRSDGSTNFHITISGLPISALPMALPPEVRASGFVEVAANGGISDNRINADGSVTLREARVDATVDDETISAVFDNATAKVSIVDNKAITSLRLTLAEGAGDTALDLAVDDVLDTGSVISGRGSIEIGDMSLFAVLIPDVTNPRGVISGNLEVTGSLGKPEFLGNLSVSDGAFGVRRVGIEISEINASLSQMSAERLRLEGSAKSGSGEISIRGDTFASADTGIRSELLITGQDFELSRLPDWQVAASPSIAVVFDDRVTSVTGNLFIPATNVNVREIPETAESPSPDVIVHRAEGSTASAPRRIDVDIAVGLGDNVRFSGFGLSTGIEGAVRIRGGTNSPYTGAGRLSLREGRYKAYGQQLEIERGQLIFNGPLDNPRLDIRAVRRTTDVTAGIQIGGTPSQLRSSLFSEPPLGDAEALSYLLTGRPLSSATSKGEGDTLNAAAFALGVSSAGNIVSQVRAGLGLETLAVEGGADDGRLIAGKRFGNRLLVEYGYGLIDKLGTLLLRYQLTDRITLESRTGTVSNLDVLYTVKKK